MNKKKQKQKGQAKKQRQWDEENATILEMRAVGPKMKSHLRKNGCDLPFYDYLDSYSQEFQRIADEAKSTYSSIAEIREVEDSVYLKPNWQQMGYGKWSQIFFKTEGVDDYGPKDPSVNLSGSVTVFCDCDQRLRTVVLIKKSAKCSFVHGELKYAIKIPALLHEIGHVHDIENGINFDIKAKTLKVIDAEVFANLYALEKMAQRQLRQSYMMLADALREAAGKDGYLGDVGRRVTETLPNHELVDWQPIWRAVKSKFQSDLDSTKKARR